MASTVATQPKPQPEAGLNERFFRYFQHEVTGMNLLPSPIQTHTDKHVANSPSGANGETGTHGTGWWGEKRCSRPLPSRNRQAIT